MLLRLPSPGDGLLEGGGGNVHRCHWNLVSHRSDRNVGTSDEDPRKQAHHHGRAPLRDAPADVVRIWIADVDDVGGWNFGLHFKVS